jgi:hypothetical protein
MAPSRVPILLALEVTLSWRWPKVAAEVRSLIRRMSLENSLWGAPRIHGELLKLGIEVAQSTVAKYMAKQRPGSGQTWKTFLHNHAEWACGEADWLDPPRMPRSRGHLWRSPPASSPMPPTTTVCGHICRWARTCRLFVLFSGSVTSPRGRSSADFIMNTA